MNYYTDRKEKEKVYLQLYRQLRRDIAAGRYASGTKLPSKRLLAEEAGVSVITVEHVYALLTDEGYIEPRERSGYFVIYRKDDFPVTEPSSEPVRQKAAPVLTGGSFPFSVYARTVRRVLAEEGERLLIKSPNRGCPELIGAVAEYLARSGISASPRQIVIGAGAEYLYGLIVQLLGRDRVFGIEDPCYEKIGQVYRANDVLCDPLSLGHRGIRTTELERTKATVLHVTPFHSYPSGVTADASKREEYLRWARQRNGFLIEDNYDSELTVSTKHEETLFARSRDGNVLYLNTFSHTVAPSVRVGYLILPETLVEAFDRKLGFYSCTVPVPEQYLLAELIRSGDFERQINRVRRKRRKEQKKD